MKKVFFLMSLLITSQLVYCSEPKKPVAPQAQRDAKRTAEASTQTSSATERWQIAKWKVLAGFRRAKLQHFMEPIDVGYVDLGNENEVFKRRIAQLELDLAQRTKERDLLGHAFERAKALKAQTTEYEKKIAEHKKIAEENDTNKRTIKLLQIKNRELAATNKALTNKLATKSPDELP